MKSINLRENKKYSITTSDNFQIFHKEILKNKVNYLTKSEEIELFKLAHYGDNKAREKIILSNLPLVFATANKHNGLGLEFDDLVSVGNYGLILAVDKFDYTLDIRFASFAVAYIRGKILDCLTRNSKTIRVTSQNVHRLSTIKKIISTLEVQLERLPTNQEIADYATEKNIVLHYGTGELTEWHIADIISTDQIVSSLDFCPNDNDDGTIEELIPAPVIKLKSEEETRTASIELALECLTNTEKSIIIMTYGLLGTKVILIDQIREKLNLGLTELRRTRAKALRKLSKNEYVRNLFF